MNYDVVIVGGGPSGISASIALSKAGASVALIERQKLPYGKTCAGILTEKTIRLLKEDLAINLCNIHFTNNVSLSFASQPICNFSTQYSFALVDRKEFNYLLINACADSGVHIYSGNKVAVVIPEKNKIVLDNGNILSYKVLIAADGVHSYVRKILKINDVKLGFCIQDAFSRSDKIRKLDGIHLDFGNISFGYSWIVPNKTQLLVGTGIYADNFCYTSMLETHNKLCSQLGTTDGALRRGAHIPNGEIVDQRKHPYENIVLVGDAAGLINPITGEGIYLALLSGIIACKAYQQNVAQLRTTYLTMLQTIQQAMAEQKQLTYKVYDNKFLKKLMYQFKNCPKYLADICDETVSLEQRSYYSVFQEIENLLR